MAALLAAAAAAAATTATAVPAPEVPRKHPARRAPRALMRRIATSSHAVASPFHPQHHANVETISELFGPRASPLNFGGDPTGVKDSTTAVQAALAVCLNQSALSPNGNFPGDTSFSNGHAVRDMGGCRVDLEGGEFLISAPIVIPEYNANMEFGGGSLVAAPHFNGSFMIVIGVPGSCRVPQGSCNIDINFPNLFLDGGHVTSAMQINNVMGVTIGPGGYFLNFTEYGVQINKGHEVMIDRCWLGETNFDYDFARFGTVPNATAIEINGNDHYVLNTIVFSSRVGLAVHGAADFIKGVHVWFPINRALSFMGPPVNAMAFFITKGGNRFDGCYADGGRCVFTEGGLARNIWTNGFECCAGQGLQNRNHGIILVGDTIGPGLQIYGNEFGGGSIWHESGTINVSSRNAISIMDYSPREYAKSAHSNKGSDLMKATRDACSSQFKYNISGSVQCSGLTHAATGFNDSPEACERRCCKEQGQGSCTMWQWCDPGTAKGCGCYFDSSSSAISCRHADPGKVWTGASVIPPKGGGGSGSKIVGVRIEDNSFPRSGVGSRAAKTLVGPGSEFSFNFCDLLVFKQIAIVRSLTVTDPGQASPPTATIIGPANCTLIVRTAAALTSVGKVFVEVDSSEYDDNLV